jgi:hypothetical protein
VERLVVMWEKGGMVGAYTAPIARINATDSLVRTFICKRQTTNRGRIPKVQSPTHEMAEYA